MSISYGNAMSILAPSLHFNADLEAQWLNQYHNKALCQKLWKRAEIHLQLLSFITLLDSKFMLHSAEYKYSCPRLMRKLNWELSRSQVFIFCRCICFVLLLGWRYVSTTRWIRRARDVQVALVLTYMAMSFLIYISYDSLMQGQNYNPSTAVSDRKQPRTLQNIFANFCMLVIFLVPLSHPFRFLSTLSFILVTIGICLMREQTQVYIAKEATPIIVFSSIICAVLSYETEKASRETFLAKKKVTETHDRIHHILNTLLPPRVLKKLQEQAALNPARTLPDPDVYERATIAQSDLCGFTALSRDKEPLEVVKMMSTLFGRFDDLTTVFQVYKVETIGDAYIAGTAEQPLTETNSPLRVLRFALSMVKATQEWAENLGCDVSCRVGIHHGACVGGIVGTGMMRYHLFGHFMLVLETLEATSKPGVVQVSEACKLAVESELEGRDVSTESSIAGFKRRDEDFLETSKGERHEYHELGLVGSRTYLVIPV